MNAQHAAAAALAVIATAALGCADGGDPIPAVGTLERDRVELVAEANEPIVEVAVREGDVLAKDQLVLRLDDTRAKARVARGQAARDQVAARLAELERGPRAERIQEARARLSGAESDVLTSRREYGRAKVLAEQEFESESRLDVQRAALQSAIARRDEARASLEALLEGTTLEELDQARSALLAAEADLVDLNVRLARLEVRAPRAGRIDALPFEKGERPPAGAVLAVLLVEGSPYARVYVPEPLRARIGPGVRATVRIDGLDRDFAARVRSVSHEAAFTPYFALTQHDRARLSYLAKVDLTEPEALELPTGLPVEVRFEPDRDREIAAGDGSPRVP